MASTANPDDLAEFDSLLATMRQLRDPQGGCPWDLQQTHASLRPTLLEETYETLDALDSGDPAAMAEELGDLLLQVVFHAQIGADERTFTIQDVVRRVNEKLQRRHPHVFGDAQADSAEEVKAQWEVIKAEERQAAGQGERSALSGVPKAMPALAYAQAVQSRAARVGLDGEHPNGMLARAQQGLQRLQDASSQEQREQELGELLFAVVGAARSMGLEAEDALRGVSSRFSERFAHAEKLSRERGVPLNALPAPDREALWPQAGRALHP